LGGDDQPPGAWLSVNHYFVFQKVSLIDKVSLSG